ncbi:MAG: glycoside hydrolase family 78 protein [Verrucomicrobia bacterium]|nr:glycoside hydrolase family 78 protein [Verrucomicrobiota bacterium]MCF7709442.1 glycoside hydrolase family 78 protein [Verrucomicrobiota bacterium]
MKKIIPSFTFLFCFCYITLSGMHPEELRCEYLVNPIGIDITSPRLSWKLSSDERGQSQSAYQIIVASTKETLAENIGDIWNSGKVESSRNNHIKYAGPLLSSCRRYHWKVRVWDKNGERSEYSNPAFWEMGLLDRVYWQGDWIGRTTDTNSLPSPMFRKTFVLDEGINDARVYICGLGYYDLFINGQKVGDHILDPGYTRYDKRMLYVTYDVTDLLNKGKNTVGVILGHGWYNVQTKAVWYFDRAPWRAAPKLLLNLRVEQQNGEFKTINTDNSWKTSTCPITFNSIYGGETYDARLEKTGWSKPDYNDSDWDNAIIVNPPGGILKAQIMQPIRITKTIPPAEVTEPKEGVYVFDFGQNMAGFAELNNISGPEGTEITMKYSERLKPDGTLDQGPIAVHMVDTDPPQRFQTDKYILNGQGNESWHARFTYHGFRYVEVTGAPSKLTKENLKAHFIHSDIPETGSFKCSNPMLNKIWENSRWAYLSNLQSIPTDCPHREKNGWTGDAHLAAEQAIFNYEPAAVYTKWINDLDDEQRASGELPGIVPTSGWGYDWGNGPAWDSAFLLIPWYMHVYYGDDRILTNHYAGFKRYVDYLVSQSSNCIVSIGLGDWSPYKSQTPEAITSTGYFYRDALILSKTAELVGKPEEALKYELLADAIKDAFNKKFYIPSIGSYSNKTQTALSCALYQDLVEPQNAHNVLSNLIDTVSAADYQIDTGILGAKYLLNALLQYNRADIAYKIINQKDKPGWGWWIEQGATTLWESWDGTASRNHIMFGDVSAWFFKALGGISPDPQHPGFKRFVINPRIIDDLNWVKTSYNSINGPIISEWTKEKEYINFNITIPVNSKATVMLPGTNTKQIQENGRPLDKIRGLNSVRVSKDKIVFELDSGHYKFTSARNN